MGYPLRDVNIEEPLKDMFILPVDLSALGKFPPQTDGGHGSGDEEEQYEDIVYVSAGIMHNIAINRNGKVFTWGSYANGRLGKPSSVAA